MQEITNQSMESTALIICDMILIYYSPSAAARWSGVHLSVLTILMLAPFFSRVTANLSRPELTKEPTY